MKVSGITRKKSSTNLEVRRSKRTYTNDSARRILRVIKDFRLKKYSKEKPIYLGKTDNRIIHFAMKNKIMVSGEGMYITAEQVAHTFRDTKVRNGIVILAQSLISFSQDYNSMDLYYDKNKKNFVYTNGTEKFINQSLDMMKVLAGKYHGVKIYDKSLANFKLKPLSEIKK